MCLLLLTASFLYKGGGGGAGALLNYTGQVMSSGSYTISVGAGGAAGTSVASATNGGNSAAFNWTAIGGGLSLLVWNIFSSAAVLPHSINPYLFLQIL